MEREYYFMKKYVVVFDVGGTTIKAAVVDQMGDILSQSINSYASNAHCTREEIITHFYSIIKKQVEIVNNLNNRKCEFLGIGYAFPGPFDYPNGISLIKRLDKYDALYGVNLKSEIQMKIKKDPELTKLFTENTSIIFENDARLFALGEYYFGNINKTKKQMYLTLGTGAGSAFLESGKLVLERYDVPKQGWIYNGLFYDSQIDDYISKRGILRLAHGEGIFINDVKELADRAIKGDQKAIDIFNHFGLLIGQAIESYIESFKPDVLVLGGQISKSSQLFIRGIEKALNNRDLQIRVSKGTSESTFRGIMKLINCTDTQMYIK
jgi:glucokinase